MPAPSIALVGPEHEENLSLRSLAASLRGAGFEPHIVPFDLGHPESVARRVTELCPLLTGVSLCFQTHARETLALVDALAATGRAGHLTAGGHFATFEFEAILQRLPALDSVVRHEGERTIVELCEALRDGHEFHRVSGLVSRRGQALEVAPARRLGPLDRLPFPMRPTSPHTVLGVPIAPILGSRGCTGSCSFCCIHAYHRHADGPRYRQRTPENLVREMESERRERGVRIFVFHDDNFLLPRRDANLRRYEAVHREMRRRGLEDVAFVIKCRPDDVDEELFQRLRSMGLIRAYVGIETNSGEGLVSLHRRVTAEHNRRALSTLGRLGVYASFNVLIFDPEATLEGIALNLDFMQEHAHFPWNFCRAEVYAGTPLLERLREEGRLRGDFLGWNYQMRDPRVEMAFRIASTVFRTRNFKPNGIANLNMGMRYELEIARHFAPENVGTDLAAEARQLSTEIAHEGVRRLRRVLEFVDRDIVGDPDSVHRFVTELGAAGDAADLHFLGRTKRVHHELVRAMETSNWEDRQCANAS